MITSKGKIDMVPAGIHCSVGLTSTLSTLVLVTTLCCAPIALAQSNRTTTSSETVVLQRLERAHPGWSRMVNTPAFSAWLKNQPPDIRELVGSKHYEDAERLLSLYKRDNPQWEATLKGQMNKPPKESEPESGVSPPYPTAPEGTSLPADVIFKRVNESVAVISVKSRVGTGQGSGVVVGSFMLVNKDLDYKWHPLIVTNSHVLRYATEKGSVTVKVAGKSYEGTSVYNDPKADIALLRIEPAPELRPVRLSSASNQAVGKPVFAVGSPLGFENSLSAGLISSIRKVDGENLIQTSAPISPGNSGGGLFNERGYLVGIPTFKIRGGENLNFAIDAETVYDIRESFKEYQSARTFFLLEGDFGERLTKMRADYDLIRMLWKERDPVSRKQFYMALADVVLEWSQTYAEGRKITPDLIRKTDTLVSAMELGISRYPKPTLSDILRETFYECRWYKPDTYQVDSTKYLWIDNAGTYMRVDDNRFPATSSPDGSITWIDLTPPRMRYTLSRSSGRIEMRLAQDERSLRNGDLITEGRCSEKTR